MTYKPSGSKFSIGQFIAWDGEGEEFDGEQRYTLLANSLGDYIYNEEGITTLEAFSFICDVAKENPYAIHVMFGGSYDANMILRSMGQQSKDLIQHVWDHKGDDRSTWYGPFQIHYVPRKELSIRLYEVNENGKIAWDDKRKRYVLESHCTIWDVWGFFQSSFVDAIGKWLGNDYSDLERIKRGKKRRGNFDSSERESTIEYCLAELKALVLMMEQLHRDLDHCGLRISRWDGAGAIACALMKKYGIKEFKSGKGEIPQEVYEAAKSAYAGGRIEAPQFGFYSDRVYHYDINSAYPEAIAQLPCLRNGKWLRTDERTTFSVSFVRWNLIGCRVYPFFYRDVYNQISYPTEGIGWHWEPEVSAALDALESGVIEGTIEILETWSFYPESDVKPFDFVNELYAIRQQWKSLGVSAEKVLKLGMNSLYGKMAQQVGYRDGEPPTYFQLEWAGYVTAFVRAKLYRASTQCHRSIIMLCTDGIFSTSKLDLECGNGLGQWDYKEHTGIFVVQSGVYWTLESPTKIKQFSRGFDKGTLSAAKVRRAMRKRKETYIASQTRFIGMGLALAGDNMWQHWCTWYTITKNLSLTPEGTKRQLPPQCRGKPWKELVVTIPLISIAPALESKPYPIRWDRDSDSVYQLQLEMIREGLMV